MNTKTLARHYENLAPMERLSLIIAASARDDDVEYERLISSAPTEIYRVPHYFGLARALNETFLVHALDLTDTAGRLLECLALTEAWREEEETERMSKIASGFGYALVAKWTGWEIFCEELHIDPWLFLRVLPCCDLIQRAKEWAERIALSEEEILALARERGWKSAQAITAESEAAELRHCLKDRAECWG